MRRLFEKRRLHLAEKTHGIMPDHLPQCRVEIFVQGAGFGMPTPPQIIRQFIEATDARRHSGKDGHAAKNFHRAWFPFFSSGEVAVGDEQSRIDTVKFILIPVWQFYYYSVYLAGKMRS